MENFKRIKKDIYVYMYAHIYVYTHIHIYKSLYYIPETKTVL